MMSCLKNLIGYGVTGLLVVLLSACGGGSGGAPAAVPATLLAANEHRVYIDAGPAGTGYNANRLYTDVTICQVGNPGNCQIIPHILVDTGSTGLRVLSSLLNPGLGLHKVNAPGGLPLLSCVNFVDNSFAWGPVAEADIQLGSKTASRARIQLIADPGFAGLASTCSTGSDITNASTLGANGILGIGLFQQDCGALCASNAVNGFYFTCANGFCLGTQGTTLPTASQIKNPITSFAADSNGVVIDLPSVGSLPAASVNGRMIFGIGTQANNQPVLSRVLTANSSGYISTFFEGRSLNRSFIDSGSNGLFFDSAVLPVCPGSGASGFYCPAGFLAFSATLTGTNFVSISVPFNVDNALNSFVGGNPVLPNLSGTLGDARSFDWGLPFFLGRKVYFGIEGMASVAGTGPFYSF